MSAFIYLASQSPRRSQLLDQLGVRHTLLLPNVEGDVAEDAEAIELALPDEAPDDYVQRVTALKLGAAVQRRARLIHCRPVRIRMDGGRCLCCLKRVVRSRPVPC